MESHKNTNSNAENQSSVNSGKFAINVSEVAIAASFVIAGLFLTGFTYIDVYLNSFGLSALEINVTYYAAVAHGFHALVEIFSDVKFLSKLVEFWGESILILIIIFQVLVMLIISSARFLFHMKGLYLAVAILLVVTCWIAVETGANYANAKVNQFLTSDEGVFAHCRLETNNEQYKNFNEQLEEKFRSRKVRKIIETRDMMYFTYLKDENDENDENIENVENDDGDKLYAHTIAIKKSDILFCRFVNYLRFNTDS